MTLTSLVILASALMALGLAGIAVNRRNIIAILMCLELMLLAVNIVFVGAGSFRADIAGQIMTFFVLTVAAAELAIGLAIVTLFFRNRGDIDIDSAEAMKG